MKVNDFISIYDYFYDLFIYDTESNLIESYNGKDSISNTYYNNEIVDIRPLFVNNRLGVAITILL